jgi:4-hydroxy-tetrahydrodipicolinate reductase
VLFQIAAQVAKQLGRRLRHRDRRGAPPLQEGRPQRTAEGLADAILRATGKKKDALVSRPRRGLTSSASAARSGMHSLRLGDDVGRHTAYFAALGERLELTHVATNRDTFVHGALRAAKWLAEPGRKPGRYAIKDVLGL